MSHLGKWLIVLGLVIVAAGVTISLAPKIPWLGRLPGDIFIRKENYYPLFPLGNVHPSLCDHLAHSLVAEKVISTAHVSGLCLRPLAPANIAGNFPLLNSASRIPITGIWNVFSPTLLLIRFFSATFNNVRTSTNRRKPCSRFLKKPF